jgi:exodeoxyribonuclease VIII
VLLFNKIFLKFMTNQEYHRKTEYISKSLLDLVHKSPAHYLAYIEGEKQAPTSAMNLGSLVHSVVFNQDNYAVLPECDRRTKEGKAIYESFMAESEDKELFVSLKDYVLALNIRLAVLAHPKAALLLEQGQAELPIFGKIADLDAKCKVDFLNTKYNVCIDLKTTTNSAPGEFAKSVWNYRYHVQAAFYMDLTKAERFIFIAVEKEAPFNVELYELDPEAIERGRQEYLADIETLKKCKETNNFHGYTTDNKIHILSLPNWVK